MGSYARERAVDHIVSLAGRGLDLRSFWDASAEAVSSAVAHYMAPCWFTLDPASLLVTSHYDHGQIPELPPEWLAQEYYADDFHDLAGVARSKRGLSTLHEASGGDPAPAPAGRQTSSTEAIRSCSSHCARRPEKHGGSWAATASPDSRSSTLRSSTFCAPCRRRSPRAPAAAC